MLAMQQQQQQSSESRWEQGGSLLSASWCCVLPLLLVLLTCRQPGSSWSSSWSRWAAVEGCSRFTIMAVLPSACAYRIGKTGYLISAKHSTSMCLHSQHHQVQF